MLEITSISKSFGGLRAVDDVTISAPTGKIVSIIGPNGAGKTTLFNVLTGVYKPDAGSITWNGRKISGLTPEAIVRHGVSRTFQNIRLFGAMTAFENVLVGHHTHIRYTYADALLRTRRFHRSERDGATRVRELLDYMGLSARSDELARNLSYGEQRRLEIARALAASPSLLLLDEPAAGMNPQESHDLKDVIRGIRDDFRLTILLIEHHMKVVMAISDHIVVLDYGRKIEDGDAETIRKSPAVIEAYLGTSALAGGTP